MNCASCGSAVISGSVCEGCASVYCAKHPARKSCEVCDGRLLKSEFSDNRLGKTNVSFLSLRGSAPIGMAGFDRLPKMAIAFAKFSRKKAGLPTTILFPTKKASYDFAEGLSPESMQWLHGALAYKPPEKSRYMVLQDEKKQGYFLVNLASLRETEAKFLAAFVPNTIAQMAWLREREDRSILESTTKILFTYSSKFGIGFVRKDDMVFEYMRMLETNMATSYAEFLALKTTISAENLASAKEFFEHKLALNFENIQWKDINYLLEVTKVLGLYAQSLLIIASTKSWAGLNEALKRDHARQESVLRHNLRKYSDVLAAIDQLKSRLEGFDFDSGYAQTMKAIGDALASAFDKLEPRYVWLNETVGLLEIGEFYSAGMSVGREPVSPEFGSYRGFMKFLSGIWKRRDVYPEVALTAARLALDLYLERLLWNFNTDEFKEAVTILDEFEARFESDVVKIRRLNPDSAYRQEDYVNELLAFAKIARLHGLAGEETRLTKIAEGAINRHRLDDYRTTLAWGRYVRTLDPYYLGEVFRATGRLRKRNYMEPQLAVMGEIARALFDQEHAMEHITKAEGAAVAILTPSVMPGSGYEVTKTAKELISSSATLLAVKMYGELLKCLNVEDSKAAVELLSSAKRYAVLTREELEPDDPFLNPTYVAVALYQLSSGDFDASVATLRTLVSRMDKPSRLDWILRLLAEWKGRKGTISKLSLLSETKTEQSDLLMAIMLKILRLKLDDDVRQTLLSSEALVFVEGDVDAAVFDSLTSKLAPKAKLRFMPTQGWTNMSYYPTMRLARELKIPMFCIFDGDTGAKRKLDPMKNRIVQTIGLQREHIITLNGNSIEDYLFQPKLLARVFPGVSLQEIERWVASKAGRRNKKEVLESFLSENNLGKYDEAVAAKLAANLGSEVPEEIKLIIRRIIQS